MTVLKRSLEVWVVLAMTTLLIVWALPGTIAARNIALFSGLSAALAWLYIDKPAITWRAALPAIFLLCVPFWIIFHYHFLSILKEQQWDEIDSTWFRTTFSITLGFCAGLIIRKRSNYFLFFIIGIIALPFLTTGFYFFQVDLQNKWILDSFVGVFKGKFSGAYFIICQILLGFACLSATFFFLNRSISYMFRMGVLGSILILSGIIDGIALRSLNIILIAGLATLVFTILLFIRTTYHFINKRIKSLPMMLSSVILSIMLAALYSFYLFDKHHEQKLANLIGDIKVAMDLETNQTWINDGRSITFPIDATGRQINGSTYERTTWFIRGVQFIAQNPLGNGITHMAFGYYMRDTYPGSKALMTHSAWVDYTLGVGLPGLFLTWVSVVLCVLICIAYLNHIFSTCENYDFNDVSKNIQFQKKDNRLTFINQQLIAYSGIWLISGLALFWIIGEVSEREYIEHYFFLISFFSSSSSCAHLFMNKMK